jgi:hypothetical protein
MIPKYFNIFIVGITLISTPSTYAAIILTLEIAPQISASTAANGIPPDYDGDDSIGSGFLFSDSVSASSSEDGAFSSANITGSTNLFLSTFTSSFSTSANWSPAGLFSASAGTSFVWQIQIDSTESFVFTWDSANDYGISSNMGPIGGPGPSGSIEVAPGGYWLAPVISYSGESPTDPGNYSYSGSLSATFSPVPEPTIFALLVVSVGALATRSYCRTRNERRRTWRCS